MPLLPLRLLFLLPTLSLAASDYRVTVVARDTLLTGSSLISRINGSSAFNYSFTTAWFPSPPGSPHADGLVVRVVECNPDHHSCAGVAHPEWTNAGALAVVGAALSGTTPFAEFVSLANVSWMGASAPPHGGSAGLWGFADPRMARHPSTGEYALTFDNCTQNCFPHRTGMLATTFDPFNASAWTFRGPLLGPSAPYSGGTALLLRDAPPHYAFVGNSDTANAINLATSEDGYTWVLNTSSKAPWMAGRPGLWDASGVASGPQPERLSSGDYLMLYNIDTGFPLKPGPLGRCSVGWAVLDGADPSRIVARAAAPLLTPVAPWETCVAQGKGPWPKCQEPEVVFATGMKPLGNDMFLVIYGGADSVVGVATIAVAFSSA